MPEDTKIDEEMEYGDLILVDLLHPDWKHFFVRYRTDILGFGVFSILMVLIILGTFLLIRIGS